MITAALTLAVVTATFRPNPPTVGDVIAIDFQQPVTLEKSADFEVVSQRGSRVVIRSFNPKPFPLAGKTGDVYFRNLVVPMQSVLKPNDDLKPAPGIPPQQPPRSNVAPIAIALALLAAAAGWFLAWRRRVRPAVEIPEAPPVAPAEAFRNAVRRAGSSRQKWAALADATRDYVAARAIRRDLTTSEVLALAPLMLDRLPDAEKRVHMTTLTDVLRRGDLEKFSPWGTPEGDFEGTARRALDLVDAFEPAPVVEAAA